MRRDYHVVLSFLSTGGWKPTRMIAKYLKDEGFNISRKALLKILNKVAECGGLEVVGGTSQKVWR